MSDHWTPAMTVRCYDRRPPIGALIAYQRKPWRVLAIDDVDPANWTDDERDYLARPFMGSDRNPFRIRVEPIGGGKGGGLRVSPWHYRAWHLLPEHYAVCVSCGELAPCLAHTSMLAAQEAMKRAERDMATLPGCCPSCQEPITHRQESVTFPGDNLLNPTAESGPTFHLRRACRGGAERYEEMWVRADPTRPRSLLTLSCGGSVIVHGDGSAECHGAEDCPSIHARHGHYAACYVQSHGCGRGCTRSGHPGTRVAGRPRGVQP